ncbi:tripartite tricarboxylate transporter substrate binding protein [Cupriavidus numazuensis]|uniref:Extra-cytoplasmic solute receptor n=1 Tax=Cupriavidus numazuensis TaxID=221992 RepID=A0ABN7QDS1_9BURK|nr:tripartite tricarboxylate transporter substrate binding protein [Cupriavidus numazuensis]CAG2159303.1 hypothetical protein LMG26411_06598 [Cupriavidus numazuensis]
MDIDNLHLSRRAPGWRRTAPWKRRLASALAAPLLLAHAHVAVASDFPTRPLRAVTPISPGSGGDQTLRYVADKLSAALGQPVVVENKPGADTYLATQYVLTTPADGYTILLVSPSLVTVPLLTPSAKYDPADFRVIAVMTRGPAVFVTSPKSRFTAFTQLVDASRKAPGSVSLAIYGNTYRVGAAMLAMQGGPKFNQISYKGVSQATADVIGGAVDVALVDLGAALPLIRAGQLRPLAAATVARVPDMPGVPTVRESGFPDFDLYISIALAVRSQTPEPAVRRLEAELDTILKAPEFRDYSLKRSASGEVIALTGKEAATMFAGEAVRFRKAAAALNAGTN